MEGGIEAEAAVVPALHAGTEEERGSQGRGRPSLRRRREGGRPQVISHHSRVPKARAKRDREGEQEGGE